MTLIESKVVSLLNEELSYTFSRGSYGLYVLFRAIAQESGCGEVVLPTLCCETVALSAIYAGHKVIFADVSNVNCCVTAGTLEAHLCSKTRAVVIVHLYGIDANTTQFNSLRRRFPHIVFIEDIAHALGGMNLQGSLLGKGLDVAMLSFSESKIIPGNFGMLVAKESFFYKYSLADEIARITKPSYLGSVARRQSSLRNMVHALADLWRDSDGAWSGDVFNLVVDQYVAVISDAEGCSNSSAALTAIDNISDVRHKRYSRYLRYRRAIVTKNVTIPEFHKHCTCWRCPLVFDSPRTAKAATNALRAKGIHASNHYFPLSVLFNSVPCPTGEAIALKLVNLWVSDDITKENIETTASIINRF